MKLNVRRSVHKQLRNVPESSQKCFVNKYISENPIAMKERDEHLLEIRPEIPGAQVSENMLPEERFQNQTLRPVIRLQNDLLVEAFRNYLQKHKKTFHEVPVEKRMTFIENTIQKDVKFRNSLKGMIIGQFTIDEYRSYITNSSALNKRMMNLVTERLKSNIQLFDPLMT